jgi:glycosyltransferase involved in cell wall biosynthesis
MAHERPIHVAALTGGRNSPAARFRVRQYIPRLEDHGIRIREYIPFFYENCGWPSPFKAASHLPGLFGSRRADLTWIGRELVRGYETFERLLKRPRVLDVDDAIWLDWPFGKYALPHIARGMDAVVAGNTFLAEWFSRYCRNVAVLPTALDLSRYAPRPAPPTQTERFTIGWTGAADSFPFLAGIQEALLRFLDDHPESEVLIVAERPWTTSSIPPERLRFVRWSAQVEVDVLHEMTVGIMPLPDSEWARGKCSFKMLQYMAVGLPVIVSPVGMNAEVLARGEVGFGAASMDDWYQALETLHRDRALRHAMGRAGRTVVERHFSADKVADALAVIFRSLVQPRPNV